MLKTDDVRVFDYFSMDHCWSTSVGATRLMVLINFLVLVFFAWRCDGGDGDGDGGVLPVLQTRIRGTPESTSPAAVDPLFWTRAGCLWTVTAL